MKILLAVDGSSHTQRMLDYLAGRPEMFGADPEFTVITVVPRVTEQPASGIPAQALQAHYEARAREVLAPIDRFADKQRWKFKSEIVQGGAAEAIAARAEAGGHDLVVMGSHGHTSLSGLVMGSVSTGVLARCKTPALIVR